MTTFKEYGLSPALQQAIDHIGFSEPTPVQAEAIPAALEGRDILATAQTGTGKTGAFAIPLIEKLINSPDESLLVLTPTRELATQVMTQFRDLLKFERTIQSALLIGGESIQTQFRQLRVFPRVVVGTPGRVNDHLKRGTLKLGRTHYLILDETDRMLDMGFGPQLETIVAKLPQERQTLMFSATLPNNIEKLSSNYLKNPLRITVGLHSTPCADIDQDVMHLSEQDKYHRLVEQLDSREGSIIVFVKTKRGADQLSDKLNRQNHSSDAIHGDLKQNRRDRVIAAFRREKYRIIVATDVAARGLDIPHIRHVINYDLPQCPEDYIHRIGRTARAGASGSALSFVTPRDRGIWRAISMLIDPDDLNPRTYSSDGPGVKGSGGGRSRSQGGRSGGGRSGDRQGGRSGGRPGDRQGGRSSDRPGGRSGPRSNGRSSERSEGGPSDRPSRWSSERPSRSGGRPEGRFSDRSSERSGDRPNSRFDDRPRSRSDDRTSDDRPRRWSNDRSSGRSDDRPAGRSSERPRSWSNDRSNGRSDDRPTSRSNDGPRSWSKDRSDSRSSERSSDRPRSWSNDRSDDRGSSRPSDRPRSRPGERPAGRPGDKPFSRSTGGRPAGRSSDRPNSGFTPKDGSRGGFAKKGAKRPARNHA